MRVHQYLQFLSYDFLEISLSYSFINITSDCRPKLHTWVPERQSSLYRQSSRQKDNFLVNVLLKKAKNLFFSLIALQNFQDMQLHFIPELTNCFSQYPRVLQQLIMDKSVNKSFDSTENVSQRSCIGKGILLGLFTKLSNLKTDNQTVLLFLYDIEMKLK